MRPGHKSPPNSNPEGIASFSPGLRGTSYPGRRCKISSYPERVASRASDHEPASKLLHPIRQRFRRNFLQSIRCFSSHQEVWVLKRVPQKGHSITRDPIMKKIASRAQRAKTVCGTISHTAGVIRKHRNKWCRDISNICQCIHRMGGDDGGIGILHQLHKVRYDRSRVRPNQLKSKPLRIIRPHLSGTDQNSGCCRRSFYMKPICNFYESGSPPGSIRLNPFHKPWQSVSANLSNCKFGLFSSTHPINRGRSWVLVDLRPLTQLPPLILRLSLSRPKRNHTNPHKNTSRQNDENPFPPHKFTIPKLAELRNLFACIWSAPAERGDDGAFLVSVRPLPPTMVFAKVWGTSVEILTNKPPSRR